MLEQAVRDFGRYGILRQQAAGKNAIDVETPFEVVRITQNEQGHISLVGWRKVTSSRVSTRRELLIGTYSPSGGWRTSVTTASATLNYGGQLPR